MASGSNIPCRSRTKVVRKVPGVDDDVKRPRRGILCNLREAEAVIYAKVRKDRKNSGARIL